MEENEKAALLELAAEGDASSWGRLLTQHADRLARMIALRLDRRLQSRIDAADVLQEIHLEAWRHLPQYLRNPGLPFHLWLRGLTRNKLCELHRQHLGTKMRDARREARYDGAMPGLTSDTLSTLFVDSGTTPSGALVREEMGLRLHEALQEMDDVDREVIALRHFEQLTPTETALVLGIHEKAAGMRYLRAVRRLRDSLASLPGGLSGFRL